MRSLNGGYDGPERRKNARATHEPFDAIVDWTAALHGYGSLEDALGRLVRLVGAEAGLAVRQLSDSGRQRRFALAEIDRSRLVADEPRESVARKALGADIAALRVGAVWMLSDARQDLGFESLSLAEERMKALNLVDVALFILGSHRGQIDFIELFFCHAFRRTDRLGLEAMAPALARAWTSRQGGTVEVLISRRKQHASGGRSDQAVDILDISNPAGLSRAEYRICALIREGLSATAIAEALSLSEATVRSHLRSVYAKTGTSGHASLLHKLTTASVTQPVDRFPAMAKGLNTGSEPYSGTRRYRPY